jgi:trigger factor
MAKKDRSQGRPALEIVNEPVPPRQARLTITVPPERVEAEMTVVAQDYARRLRVPGYRPGKVPLALVVSQVGEEPLRQAVAEQLVDRVAREALRAEEILPYRQMILEDTSEDPLRYTILVPLAPEVDLGDYRSLRVPRPAPEPVSEEEVTRRLEAWRQESGHLETVERPAEPGDTVLVSLAGQLGGELIVEHDTLDLVLEPDAMSEHDLPTELVERIVGHEAGETVRTQVTYSEFWPEAELQGRAVDFEISVEGVMALVLPELDDDFAREVSDAESLAALAGRVRDRLEATAALEAREIWRLQAIDELVAGATLSYPPQLAEEEVEGALARLRGRVEQQGFAWEHWLQLQGKDEDAILAEVEPEALSRLARTLVLSEFAVVENIAVGRSDVEAELRRRNEQLSSVGLKLRKNDLVRGVVADELLTERTLNRLLEIVGGQDGAAEEAVDGLDGEGEGATVALVEEPHDPA